MKKIYLLTLIVVSIISCKKEPGEGGFASIEGKLYVQEYDDFFQIKISEHYVPGENVYIIYGDGTDVGNSVKTSYDGSFKFPYLQKGKYKVFVVGKDSASGNRGNDLALVKEITITEKKQKIDLGDLTILN